MIRYITVTIICAVLMALMVRAFPLRCAAENAPRADRSDSKIIPAESSRQNEKEPDKEEDGDWMIFLSIGAGITIVAIVIAAIASRDAK